ncbi:NAD(P)-dependent oxidoreductase [Jannaschia pohangensis]|uniref:NAD(P)H-binding n=1 Tax=Jannaschia pohangensis TaxID=390807 RepID=A0A1I3JN49_9RHOB|nr:NAD(P)H-binding protein [Jannaschia pohangensis]SFI61702.1 NAD(P)H-binding [Jannaschia pohangensis]
MHILIYGADGATGTRLVEQALARGHRVRASVVDMSGDHPEKPGLDWVTSDILSGDDLSGDMAGIDAVINAVGLAAGLNTVVSPPPLYTEGTRNILRAMRGAGVDRYVTISASFVETLARGPIWFEAAAALGLSAIFNEMEKMEGILHQADWLRWTAVRPGWLLDEEASGDFQVFDDVIPEDLIRTRTGDLAQFMLECAEGDLHIRATPAISRPEPAGKSGPDAVLAEMLG